MRWYRGKGWSNSLTGPRPPWALGMLDCHLHTKLAFQWDRAESIYHEMHTPRLVSLILAFPKNTFWCGFKFWLILYSYAMNFWFGLDLDCIQMLIQGWVCFFSMQIFSFPDTNRLQRLRIQFGNRYINIITRKDDRVITRCNTIMVFASYLVVSKRVVQCSPSEKEWRAAPTRPEHQQKSPTLLTTKNN